jgi:outer membrane protein
MKNLSLILNVVLLVAVAILFFLHFSSGKSGSSAGATGVPSDVKIAYINSDTVLKYYDYREVAFKQLETKATQMDQDFRNRAQGLQNEIAAYQRNVNSMTLGQVKSVEEDLGKKQQNLQMYQQSLNQQVMMDQEKVNRDLYERVTKFLKKYAAEKGIQIVLKYDLTSDVMQVSEALDISQDVIKGLNDEYTTEKSGVKKDSTATK